MLVVLAIALAGVSSVQETEFTTDQVRIAVNIRSSIYEYHVTNLSRTPIVRFEVAEHAAYNFEAPEGWEKEVSSGVFRAWTNKRRAGILLNKTAMFSLRVSSRGAVLGRRPVTVGFRAGENISVPNVLSAVPEPASHVGLVAGVILVILLLHTIVLVYRDRRAAGRTVSGP